MKETSKAWAVKMHISGHKAPCFLGIFNWTLSPIAPCQDGMRTALFRTRSEARAAAKKVWEEPARAVRVVVEIKEA